MKCEIEKLDNFGRGITYYNNKICFIDGAFPGDIVSFDVICEKNKYIEGKVNKIYSYSDGRVESKCPFSCECGGCVFQEYNYSLENKYKEEKLKSLVKRQLGIDNVVSDIIYDNDLNYRNKIVLHGSNGLLGLYKANSNDIVKIDKCILCNEKINNIISILNNYSNIDEVMIRTNNDLSSVLVSIKGNLSKYDELASICDVLIVNGKLISKDSSIITSIGNNMFYLSADSFFQINLSLTTKLFDTVLGYVKDINPEIMLDLYCGTGTFGIYVSHYVSKVIGIDYNRSNIDDALKNAKLNNVDNIKFICDKVENVIDNYDDIDLVIVDPPRSGLDKKTLDNLVRINSKNIIYVSCDPVTLVRDLKILLKKYNILKITPFNMFPRTYHVECVSLLSRKT